MDAGYKNIFPAPKGVLITVIHCTFELILAHVERVVEQQHAVRANMYQHKHIYISEFKSKSFEVSLVSSNKRPALIVFVHEKTPRIFRSRN